MTKKREDDLTMPVTVGQTPPPRDHVAPRTATFGEPLTGQHGDPVLGSIRLYLKSAEEHAGKCAAALELAIDAAQRDVVLAGAVPTMQQAKQQVSQIEKRIRILRAGK